MKRFDLRKRKQQTIQRGLWSAPPPPPSSLERRGPLAAAGEPGPSWRRSSGQGALPLQWRLQRPDTAPLASVTTAAAVGAPSPAQGAPSSHTLRDTPTNFGGHPTSESPIPALSSPTSETFLAERQPSDLRGPPAAPGSRCSPRHTGTHPPGPPPARRDRVPAPPGGRARPTCSDPRASRPRPPASKLPGPAPAPTPGPAGLPTPDPQPAGPRRASPGALPAAGELGAAAAAGGSRRK